MNLSADRPEPPVSNATASLPKLRVPSFTGGDLLRSARTYGLPVLVAAVLPGGLVVALLIGLVRRLLRSRAGRVGGGRPLLPGFLAPVMSAHRSPEPASLPRVAIVNRN